MADTLNLLPCPFCGGKCDPEGWEGTGIAGEYLRGPECEQCGATADTVEGWNHRASQPTEAGAPTAAAEVPRELLQRCLTSMKHAVTFGETGKGRPPSQTCMFEIEELEAYLAGRESAPPLAKQDAKDGGHYHG